MNTDRDKMKQAVVEQASDWVVRLHEPELSKDERAQFVRWLKRSPVHVHEFLQTEADWLALEDIDASHAVDVDALLSASAENVVSLTGSSLAAKNSNGRRRYASAVGLAAAAVLAGAVFLVQSMWPEVYDTALGEQRTVVLADGSIVELNTQSRIRVRMSEERRDVNLLAGEALFSVKQDPARPFRVFSDSVEVRAVGTQFNVYRQSEQTIVTVLEGKVEVRQSDGDSGSTLRDGGSTPSVTQVVGLGVGDQLVVQSAVARRTAAANTERVVAWRERRLVFENDTLADVAAEFNRYNNQRIVVEGNELAARRINGVFNADRPEIVVQFLTRSDDVELMEQPGVQWLLRSKPER